MCACCLCRFITKRPHVEMRYEMRNDRVSWDLVRNIETVATMSFRGIRARVIPFEKARLRIGQYGSLPFVQLGQLGQLGNSGIP